MEQTQESQVFTGHKENKISIIKGWFKDRSNWIIIGILVLAILYRSYYFYITIDQPLWWDEAVYMASAKGFAGIMDYQLEAIRTPGFPLLMSLFYLIGITSEPILRFFGLLLPSLALIFLAYYMLKEMYLDKRIALISAAIITTLFDIVFYSNRFQTETFALIFQFLAIIVLFKCYLKKEQWSFIKPKHSLLWIAAFSLLSIVFRSGNAPFVGGILLFLPVFSRRRLTDKKVLTSLAALLALGAIGSFFLREKLLGLAGSYFQLSNPIGWIVPKILYDSYYSFIPGMPTLFFYAFIIGLFIVLIDIFLNKNRLISLEDNSEDLALKSDIFNLLLIFSIFFVFMFLLRIQAYENRWLFSILPALFAFTAKGFTTTFDYLAIFLKNKKVAMALMILVLAIGSYSQIVHVDAVVKAKITSYQEVKDSGFWIKENSDPSDAIVSASVPQHSYYSERKVYNFGFNGQKNETLFDQKIQEIKPKYVIVSAFEPSFTPEWAYTWAQRNPEIARPVNIYSSQGQTLLVVYELDYNGQRESLNSS